MGYLLVDQYLFSLKRKSLYVLICFHVMSLVYFSPYGKKSHNLCSFLVNVMSRLFFSCRVSLFISCSLMRVYFFCLCAYFTCRNVFLLSCDVFLNHHFTYTLLLRSHTYTTIVGLDFRPPSDAAEWAH